MDLNEALRILIDKGMLVEKKYRTTPEERKRTKDSWYDTYGGGTIEEKTRKIIEEFGLNDYLTNVSFGERSVDVYYTENKTLNYIINRLEPRFSFEIRTYDNKDYMKFFFDVDERLVRDKLEPDEAIADALYRKFGVPKDLLTWNKYSLSYYSITNNYDKVEYFIEDKQYDGIHDLNFNDFKETVSKAFKWAKSEENRVQYITNRYGREKQIDEYYAKFRQICKILSKELNRKRGKL